MENKMLELLKTRRSVRSYKPEQIAAQELDAVLEAGTYAPTGMGMQSPVIVAVQDAQTRQAVMELNQQARGGSGDPYYGAPTIVLVLADPEAGHLRGGWRLRAVQHDERRPLPGPGLLLDSRGAGDVPAARGQGPAAPVGPAGDAARRGLIALGYAAGPPAPAQAPQRGLHPQGVSRAGNGKKRVVP